MIMSKMNKKNYKLSDLDSMYPAQAILLQSGQLVQYESGLYGYGNTLTIAQNNLENIIRKKMNDVSFVEVSLPTMQPSSIWLKSGRWDKYKDSDSLFVIEANGKDYCLAPTAEEAMVEFLGDDNLSEKSLPFTYYQFGNKYRNEIRTRGYLLRGKAFRMFDGYSFCKDDYSLDEEYEKVKKIYLELFDELNLDCVPVAAVNGEMGGKSSEEFMVISELGEDTILFNSEDNIGINKEVLELSSPLEYLKREYGICDISTIDTKKAIEVGHIFKLGDNYSKMMNLNYNSSNNKQLPVYMGCYGIGVSRLLASIYENSLIYKNDKPIGMHLPFSIAPYVLYIIIGNNLDKNKEAFEIYDELLKNDVSVIIDDRNVSIGQKVRECKAMGIPYMSVFGNKTEKGTIELENTESGNKINIDKQQLFDLFVGPRKVCQKKLERRM